MKIGHVLSYTQIPFHILLTHPFTKPYTPIPSINIPFLTIISLTFSILKTPKLISELNYLLFYHLLSFLFHNHKTFHFFFTTLTLAESIPPSLSIFFTCFWFSFLIFYIFMHFLSIANNMPKTRATSSKRPHIEETPQEEEKNLSKTYKAKFLILSHA